MGGASRVTILLVDDDAPGRYVTGRLLRGAGYEVREAASSSEALTAVAVAPPDLVLLDIRLPTLGGAAVLARIKANQATAVIPVVYLSGSFADDDSVITGLEEGADAYLIKPVSPSVLLATVKALLRTGRLSRELEAARREAERRAEEAERAEAAQRESEERHRHLFDTMQEGVQLCEIITDAEGAPVDFRYLEVNPVAARVLGHTREELIGHTRNEVLRDPDPKWAALYGEVALTGRPASAELYATVLGRWIEVHVYSPRPGQFASIFTDITERRQAEEQREQLLAALRRQQAFLDAVLAQFPAGVVIADAPSGRVILGNEEMVRVWRHPVPAYADTAEYGGLQGYHPDGRQYTAEEWPLVRAVQKGETVVNEEISIIRGDGSRGTLLSSASPIHDDTGEVIAGVVVSSDVTDLMRVQRELERRTREAEEGKAILDALVEYIPEGLSIADAGGRVIRVSRYGLRLSDRSPQEVIGTSVEDPAGIRLLRADGATPLPPGELPLVRAVRRGEVVANEECVLQRRDGQQSPLLCTAAPIRDQFGSITGGIAAWRDITDLKALEAHRLAAERGRAELAENLSNEIAHRVKNNLAMISGLLQMQLLGQQDPQVAAALREAITRVRTFVNIHERMYSSESGPVDLLAILRSIAGDIGKIFAARDDLAISVTGRDLPCASRVATNLSVMANELLLNALKHGAPDRDGRLRVELSAARDRDRVAIAVWNSGPPVPADFDAARHRSMGLRVVLDIVHGYGGTFALRPDGAGTRAEAVLELEKLQSAS